jgi:hypothetical protein
VNHPVYYRGDSQGNRSEACLSKALEALRKSSQATQTCREGHGEQKVSISFQQARKELKGTKEESA